MGFLLFLLKFKFMERILYHQLCFSPFAAADEVLRSVRHQRRDNDFA